MTMQVPALARANRLQTTEIRMLGPLRVQRSDGSTVDSREWRTGKTADLVRLLALRVGEPVPTTTLLTTLWPNSDQGRAQASLRTAVSQVRQVLGRDCIERSLGGLRLSDAWVDVVAFRALTGEVRKLMRTGDMSQVETLAREADALYSGDLRANDDGAEWVVTERRSLASAYQVLLCDAADATAARGLARESVDFASRALAVDPFCERACRAVMRGHAEMGATPQALREYERCRRLLAEELGVDPSQPTRDLHLELLRNEPPAPTGERAQRYRHPEQVVRTDGTQLVNLSARTTRAQSSLESTRKVSIAQDGPAVSARAILASWLPDVLLGGAREAAAPLAQAASLAAESDDELLGKRLNVLQCLIAHDLAGADFEARWEQAAAACEIETDVNWAWLMIRIATERGDLATAQLANRLPIAPAAGRLARQLRAMSAAALLTELGDVDAAIEGFRGVIDLEDRAGSALLLPEALARLVMVLAPSDPCAAEITLARLDLVLSGVPALPREACLRLLAAAAVQSARSRAAAAAASAASAAEVAEEHGLRVLAAAAHTLCERYTAQASTLAADSRWLIPRLLLTLSSVDS